jgi:hypothetical protein
MSYDYKKSSEDLFRAIFFDNYEGDVSCYLRPDEELSNSKEIAPILHPAYVSKSPTRPPDISPKPATGKYHPDTGGTSTFDRAGVLRSSNGDFFLPEGTDIPPDLKIQKNDYNKSLKATHFTIMPSKPLQKSVLEASLNQLVRSAIKRQYEKARGL